MKIYTNDQHEIVGRKIIPKSYTHEYGVDDDFGDQWCDAALFGFCYAPSYELDFNEDGTIKQDRNGNDLYRLDEAGQPVQTGMAFYPYIDFNIIQSIQNLYEKEEEKQAEIDEYSIDLDYRLSCLELGI